MLARAASRRLLRAGRIERSYNLQHIRLRSYLAPPFLLDDYTPRYQLLTSVQESKKRSAAYAHLRNCNLCPRLCGVNRFEKTGACLIGADVVVNTVAPHFGEEPCLQGHNGSGSVFFSGCNLRCVFCQNHDIAHQKNGFNISPEELAEWYIKLQDVGNVHNINLVTPEHVVPQVVLSILHAKQLGLRLPIVYNTSSFDSLASIKLLDGLVDIYLPDFKVWNADTSKRLLKVENYADVATESIKAMHDQVGDLCFTSDGIAKKGVLLRHLVMPGYEEEGKLIVRWLAENVSKDLYIHVMEQYHPRAHVGKERRGRASALAVEKEATNGQQPSSQAKKQLRYADINRAVSLDEVESVRRAAEQVGVLLYMFQPCVREKRLTLSGWSLAVRRGC
jgi:putative pyruvate formate lyase activating enzyme